VFVAWCFCLGGPSNIFCNMADSSIRQRKAANSSAAKTVASNIEIEDSTSRIISPLDILRIIVTLLVASTAFSYYLTDTLTWGYQPNLRKLQQQYLKGEVILTPAELALHNGTDPSLPIYIAINNTVFDVTAGKHTYGPGGSYSVFAGKHATRAFVTGCFAEDATNDMRGVEMMHIPVEDDPDEVISSGHKKVRMEKDRREAKKKMLKEVEKWDKFYRESKKYFVVGRLVGEEQDTFEGPAPALCAQADKGRPKRSKMNASVNKAKEKQESPGKPVQ
jgi:predicted heme/steroid binding protein